MIVNIPELNLSNVIIKTRNGALIVVLSEAGALNGDFQYG